MTYVEPDVRRIVLVKGRDTAFSHRLRLRADDTIPSTPTGLSAVVSKGATSIATPTPTWDVVNGAFTGTIAGSDTSATDLDEDPWSLVITATVGGASQSFYREVVFVPREIHPSVLISDLLEDYPALSSPLGASTSDLIIDREEALAELDKLLLDKGVEMHRVRSRETLRRALALLIVATRYRKASETADDETYRQTAEGYRNEAANLLGERIDYDADQNGVTDTKPTHAGNDEGDFFFRGRRS